MSVTTDKQEKGLQTDCFCVILMCAFFGFQLKVLKSHKFATDLEFLTKWGFRREKNFENILQNNKSKTGVLHNIHCSEWRK